MTTDVQLDHEGLPSEPLRKPSPLEVFVGMFIWPRQIIKALLDAGPLWSVTILLAGIAGARSGIQNGLEKHIEEPGITLEMALATSVVGQVLGGLVGFFLFGWVYYGVGKSLGGTGRQSDVYHAFARCLIPSFAGFFPLGVMLVLASSGQEITPAYLAMTLLYLVILIWSTVSLIRGLAEAHRFSSWRSLAAFVLCALVFVIAIFAVVMVVAAAGLSA